MRCESFEDFKQKCTKHLTVEPDWVDYTLEVHPDYLYIAKYGDRYLCYRHDGLFEYTIHANTIQKRTVTASSIPAVLKKIKH